jgi:hypothetical protein
MRLIVAVAVLGFSLVVSVGCGERPAPPPPVPTRPASAWTAADSQAVAKELAASAASQDWAITFRTRMNRAPKILVGEIQDKTGDNVDVAELASELEKDVAGSQQLTVVKDRADADFLMSGGVGREAMTGGWRYTVDLRLTTPEGDPVWIDGREREVKAAGGQ